MENIDLNFLPTQTSAIRVTGSAALASNMFALHAFASPNAIPFEISVPMAYYHQYSSSFINPITQFGVVEQDSLFSRASNFMQFNFHVQREATWCAFMSTPSSIGSSIMSCPTATSICPGISMADPIQRLSSAKAHEALFFSRNYSGINFSCYPCHRFPNPYLLNHISVPVPSHARIHRPFLCHGNSYPQSNQEAVFDHHHFRHHENFNRDSHESLSDRILSYAREPPTKYFKCNPCRKRFRTGMALGGHMSSHTKNSKVSSSEIWQPARMARGNACSLGSMFKPRKSCMEAATLWPQARMGCGEPSYVGAMTIASEGNMSSCTKKRKEASSFLEAAGLWQPARMEHDESSYVRNMTIAFEGMEAMKEMVNEEGDGTLNLFVLKEDKKVANEDLDGMLDFFALQEAKRIVSQGKEPVEETENEEEDVVLKYLAFNYGKN